MIPQNRGRKTQLKASLTLMRCMMRTQCVSKGGCRVLCLGVTPFAHWIRPRGAC